MTTLPGFEPPANATSAEPVPARHVARLLAQIGDKDTCKACGQTIYWVRLRSGRTAPITLGAVNHFSDCPEAPRFRRARQ